MKKTLLATLVAAMLVLSALAIAIPTSAAAGDYIIFGGGQFVEGGEILDGCGTIIEDGYLVGGEGINNGAQGTGWFQITIDGTGGKDAWSAYKYLRIVGSPYKCGEKEATGAYNGGTVQFGAGNTYNFDQLELTGKTMGAIEKEDCYLLDLSKVSTFEANWFLMSHSARGYKIAELALTDSEEYTSGGAGTGPAPTDAPADPTDAPADPTDAPTAAPTDAPTAAPTVAPTTATPIITLAPTVAPTTAAPTVNPGTGVAGIGAALAVAGLAAAGLVVATKKSK